jgi:integration host factor subunit beta
MAHDPADPATITKRDLVDQIAAQSGLPKLQVKDVVQRFMDLVVAELARGNRLELREFGVFEVHTRAPRRAQNPRTLEKVEVPGKRVVKFKVGLVLRNRLREPAHAAPAPESTAPKPAPVAPKLAAPPPPRSNSPF